MEGSDGSEEERQAGEELLFGISLGDLQGAQDAEVTNPELAPLDLGKETTSHDEKERPSYAILVDELLQYQDSLPTSNQEDLDDLFSWAIAEGARLDGIACESDKHGGRCVVATADTPEGATLAMLSRKLRLGQAFACKTLELPIDTPALSALTLLILHLSRTKHPYSRCLPRKQQFTNALLMSTIDEKKWNQRGDDYAHAIRRVRSIRDGCQYYIKDVLASPKCSATQISTSVDWAMSMVKSRSHAFGSKKEYWLTPVLDMLNHSILPNAKLVGGNEGQLLLKALHPVAKGEEVLIDYQVEDDSMLLATYGFSLKFPDEQSLDKI